MRRPVTFPMTGDLPDAPLPMPKQVLEARASWLMALRSALARTAVRS